ncbi:MAG: hypothetical protein GF375_07765, partial [Candidatus Omnitrophica bacterium]|nr:hypothetical protein [Candidatus Omnitrophota bacterium]MBD3269858.1 hypothetical protein [Candidatus Omnitrophota bacterium]
MCYAIPGKVKEIDKKSVLVDYFGQTKKAVNEFYDIRVGDYILAQGGFVIRKVPPAEAKETLSVWGELFFRLQDVDLRLSSLDLKNKNISRKLQSVLDKSFEGIELNLEELRYLFNLNNPGEIELVCKGANYLRQKFHRNSCCVHGIIEISSYCKRHCRYCGISTHNRSLNRYRMSSQQIVDTAVEAVRVYKFGALVLQSGEDPEFSIEELCEVIRSIKSEVPVLICVSFGEVGLTGLGELYRAGARGLLLRFETSS